MYPSKTRLYAPTRATAPSLFNHSMRNQPYSSYSVSNYSNPYTQLEAQKPHLFPVPANYPCAPPSSGFMPAYQAAPLYSYAIPVNALPTNSSPGLEAVLIAILILTALDLTLIRPHKYSRKE